MAPGTSPRPPTCRADSSAIYRGNPQSMAVGDFNGDAKADLAVANLDLDSVAIRLGDGAGNFRVAPDVSVGESPRSVAVADFNSEARPTWWSQPGITGPTGVTNEDTLAIRFGDGAGTSPRPSATPPGSPSRTRWRWPTSTETPRPTWPCQLRSNNVSVRLGDGTGGFSFPAPAWGASPDRSPWATSTATDPDFAAANYDADYVSSPRRRTRASPTSAPPSLMCPWAAPPPLSPWPTSMVTARPTWP